MARASEEFALWYLHSAKLPKLSYVTMERERNFDLETQHTPPVRFAKAVASFYLQKLSDCGKQTESNSCHDLREGENVKYLGGA